jgi:para-nitrobenzyl esterase
MTVVTTTVGKIKGTQENQLKVFRGIPFAAPPVGDLRWQAPQPHPGWDGVRDASKFGAEAPQDSSMLDWLMGQADTPPEQTEDCLFLNIWTPATAGKRPVMFWIHGGGFTMGSGSQPIYDGQHLADRGDVVVVTINYRMGALGFLNLKALTGGKIPATGNEGLLDQVAALEWTRDNISVFGGDPANITIFGESAGGMSVGCLMAMPAAKGLFHKAIPQSGACHSANSPEKGLQVAELALELLGTFDPSALLALPVSAFSELQVNFAKAAVGKNLPGMGAFRPNVDGTVLPEMPINLVRKGSAAGVAVMTGTCREEWRLFAVIDPARVNMNEQQLQAEVAAFFPDTADKVIAKYREWLHSRHKASLPVDVLAAFMTDQVFRIPALRLLEAQSEHAMTYSYLFDWPSPLMAGVVGACHAVELGFNWGTYDKNGSAGFFVEGREADLLSARTMDAWLSFAREGVPSSSGLPEWPVYSRDVPATMRLSTEPSLLLDPDHEINELWADDPVIGSM